MNIRPVVVSIHRWISLAAVAFWLLQAMTGVFAVFHWEIDDGFVRGEHRPTDFRAIERSVAGQSADSIWTSAGALDRYDVYFSNRIARIDGVGNVLRVTRDGGFVSTVISLHHDLLAGERGRTIVGCSGLLLFSNVLLGITAAWPRARQWRRALRPARSGSRTAIVYSWHRAVGLCIAIPLLFLVAAGVLLAFEETTERLLNGGIEAPTASGTPSVGMAEAVERALERYPGAAVSGIDFPRAENAVWRITLKQRGELRRYGKTRVFVSAIDGRILADFDALNAPAGRRVFESLFAFHTGEMGGIAGRVFVTLIGLTLIALMLLGLNLWFVRRSTRP